MKLKIFCKKLNKFSTQHFVFLMLLAYFVSLAMLVIVIWLLQNKVDPDEKNDAIQLIKSRGFGVEVHHVLTEDGYGLELQRLINPYLSMNGTTKTVLLRHGIGGSSVDYLFNERGMLNERGVFEEDGVDTSVTKSLFGQETVVANSLGFVLSQFGFDVWLMNARGNYYSTFKTDKRDPQDSSFWKFSMNEQVVYDLPVTINYVLNVTKSDHLAYIGFSQGNQVLFALLSETNEFDDKIKPFIALAPVAFVDNVKSYAKISKHIIFIANKIKPGVQVGTRKSRSPWRCRNKILRYTCCTNFLLFDNVRLSQLIASRIPVYKFHSPSGTSWWNMLHMGQMVKRKKFAKFDYGSKSANKKHYSQDFPPYYLLQNITSRNIALFYSEGDALADLKDVKRLKSSLKVPFKEQIVEKKDWGHVTFIIGKKTGKYVNSKVIDILRNTV